MKYAVLVKGNPNQIAEKFDSVGFYQWLKLFQGRIIGDGAELEKLQDGDFDLIHIRLIRENLELVDRLRIRLGPESATKIGVSLDIPVRYWDQYIDDRDHLKNTVLKADFVFGSEYEICRELALLTGKNVYEIPHPANLERIRSYRDVSKNDVVTIISGRPGNVLKSITRLRLLFGTQLKIQVLAYRYQHGNEVEFYRKRKIEFIHCNSEAELCYNLVASRFVLIPEVRPFYGNEYHNYENLIVYAAALGVVVVGGPCSEVICRCYSQMVNAPFEKHLLTYYWLKEDPQKIANLVEEAQVRVEYYDYGNLQKRFLDWLYQECGEARFVYQNTQLKHRSLFQQIEHLHGEKRITYERRELAVVCLVKNGAQYLKTFMDYYNRLGTKHFFFIDNGSTDPTIKLLKEYPNVTIYTTKLPHKKYECEIRRAIIEEHCRNCWCLCVDIDELFDYPYSDRISMERFLEYLNIHHYTAVLSYLLEMFSPQLQFGSDQTEDLIAQYCYYDISTIRRERYNTFVAFTKYNRLADPKMRNYSGGIRQNFFKNKESGYLLTKHPLIFVDSRIEPVVHPHYSHKVFVADVNGVLKHYKFISSFKDKVIRSLESRDYCYYAEKEYQEYYKVIKDKNSLNLYSSKSKKLEQTEELVWNGFLKVSKTYRDYLKSSGRY